MICVLSAAATSPLPTPRCCPPQPDTVYDTLRKATDDIYLAERRTKTASNDRLTAPHPEGPLEKQNVTLKFSSQTPPQPTPGIDRYSGEGFLNATQVLFQEVSVCPPDSTAACCNNGQLQPEGTICRYTQVWANTAQGCAACAMRMGCFEAKPVLTCHTGGVCVCATAGLLT